MTLALILLETQLFVVYLNYPNACYSLHMIEVFFAVKVQGGEEGDNLREIKTEIASSLGRRSTKLLVTTLSASLIFMVHFSVVNSFILSLALL